MTFKRIIVSTVLVLPGLFACSDSTSSTATEVTVYKSPTCGCCNKWIAHLEDSGFKVTAHDTSNLQAIKDSSGVSPPLASCHTAIVDGYVIEGHVPAKDIRRLLTARPAVVGIAVPGMPMGSPGMEGPQAGHYDVLTFDNQGRTSVFTRY